MRNCEYGETRATNDSTKDIEGKRRSMSAVGRRVYMLFNEGEK